MSNANAQPQKDKGLYVGSQIRCFKLTTGNKQDGSMWGMLTHVEKDSNKNVIQKYTLWLGNDSNFIANFPINKMVDLKIIEINGVRPEWKRYTKNGNQVNERIINLDVKVEILNVMDNPYNNQAQTYQNYNNGNNYKNTNANNGYQQQPQNFGQQQQPQYFDVGGNKFAQANQQAKQYQASPEENDFLNSLGVSDDDLPF